MQLTRLALAFLLSAAVATASDRLPSGAYADQDEGGVHHTATSLGGLVVVFDGQPFFWNGLEYTNGLWDLEFIEILPGASYGFVLEGPGGSTTGIVDATG